MALNLNEMASGLVNGAKGALGLGDKAKEEKAKKKDDIETLRLVRKNKDELAKYRRQFESDWKIFDDAYYGKQHLTGANIKQTRNYIFKTIEGEVPILSDSLHGTLVLSHKVNREDDAKMLEGGIKYVYQKNNLPILLSTTTRESLKSAPGYLWVSYDPDASNGSGEIKLHQAEWRDVWLDGNVYDIQDSALFQIDFRRRRDECIRMYPAFEEKLKQAQNHAKIDEDSDSAGQYETRDISDPSEAKGAPTRYQSSDVLTISEQWIKSFDLEDIPVEVTEKDLMEEAEQLFSGTAPDITKWENHDYHIQAHIETENTILANLQLPPGTSFDDASNAVDLIIEQNPQAADQFSKLLLSLKIIENHKAEHEENKKLNPSGQRPKFKDGWRIIRTVGNVVVYDGKNPREDGLIPIAVIYCYKDGTIYGFGEVKNILSPQQSMNEMSYKEYKNLKLNANSGWITDKETMLTEKELTNEDGLVVRVPKGMRAERLPPAPVSNHFQVRKESDEADIESISGIGEATNPTRESSGLSGVAITKLQNQAIGRVRLKDRNIAYFTMHRLGLIVASFIVYHWSTEKKLRFKADGDNISELVFDPIKVADLEYSIEIAPGSMAGIDRDALNNFFKTLLDNQHITFREFLMVADFPKKSFLLDSLNKREDMQGQLQKIQIDNLKMKAMIQQLTGEQLLTPEETKQFQEITVQENNQKLLEQSGANTGQPGL